MCSKGIGNIAVNLQIALNLKRIQFINIIVAGVGGLNVWRKYANDRIHKGDKQGSLITLIAVWRYWIRITGSEYISKYG